MRNFELTSDIFKLFERRAVANADGKAALMTALIISMIDDGVSKDRAMTALSQMWDLLEPTVGKIKQDGLN